MQEWSLFDQGIVDRAMKEWPVRLKACIQADGGHFEHKLHMHSTVQRSSKTALFRAT